MYPDLTLIKTVKKLLQGNDIKPLRRMGQNFLVSRKVLGKIIETAELKPDNIVLEVGPGLGTLTVELAKKVKQVIAVEKDKRLVGTLNDILKSQNIPNIEILKGDILKPIPQISHWFNLVRSDQVEPRKVVRKNYKVVASLPYNIATAVIMKFLEADNPPNLMVVLLQKEVGQRICSKPPKMSKIGVFCQLFSVPNTVNYVSKKSFWPQPRVDSVILKIVPLQAHFDLEFRERFARIVRAGFSHPRKQLVNNFSKELNCVNLGRSSVDTKQNQPRKQRGQIENWLLKNNIKPTQRAESLSLNNWIDLTESFT